MIYYFTTNLLLNPSISLLHSFLELITTSLHSLISILSHFITSLPHLTSLPLSPPLTLPPFTGYESNEQDRPQFEGEEILSPVDGKRILYFAKADKEYRARIANVSTDFIFFFLFYFIYFFIFLFFIFPFFIEFIQLLHTHSLPFILTHSFIPHTLLVYLLIAPHLISSLTLYYTYQSHSFITHLFKFLTLNSLFSTHIFSPHPHTSPTECNSILSCTHTPSLSLSLNDTFQLHINITECHSILSISSSPRRLCCVLPTSIYDLPC